MPKPVFQGALAISDQSLRALLHYSFAVLCMYVGLPPIRTDGDLRGISYHLEQIVTDLAD